MGLRTGQIFSALSGGLGDLANVAYRREQEKINREWEMTLANLRERNAMAREKRQYAHAEQLARDRQAADAAKDAKATERYIADREATAKFRSSSLSQDERQAQQKRADTIWSSLQSGLQDLGETYRKATEEEMFDESQREALDRWYQGERDNMIVSAVGYGNKEGLPGFEASDEGSLAALLSRFGMPHSRAKANAAQIWPQIDPNVSDDDLFADTQGGDHPRDNPAGWFYEDRGYDLPEGVQRGGGIVGQGELFQSELARRGGTSGAAMTPPPTPGAPTITPPPAPGADFQGLFPDSMADPTQPQPWENTRRFGREVGRRFGQVPTNSSPTYGGPRGTEWMYGMGQK